jgi:hypothetical protein
MRAGAAEFTPRHRAINVTICAAITTSSRESQFSYATNASIWP